MLSFTAPDGWEIPPDAKPGQPFKGVGTFMLGKDGKTVSFTEIDGTPLSDAADDMEEVEDEEVEVEEPVDQMAAMAERAKAAGLLK